MDAVGILVLKKTKANIELNKRVNELVRHVEKLNFKIHNEEEQFVLVHQGDAIELKLRKLVETSQNSLCIMVPWQIISQWIVINHKIIRKALEKKVNIRVITEQQINSNKSKDITALEKYPNFEIRYIVGPPSVWLRIKDDNEIVLNTKSSVDTDFAVLSNNHGLIELAQSFFNSAWFSAIEPQEREFKRDRRQFDYLFANMSNGFAYNKLIYDNEGKLIDFVIIEANSAFQELTGITRTEFGKNATKFWPNTSQSLAELLNTYGETVATGSSVSFLHYFQTLEKWISVLAFSPEKGYFATIFEDVTERKRSEEAIRLSDQRYRSLFEVIASGIVVQDKNGLIIEANEMACEILGLSLDQIKGRTSADPKWQAIHEDNSPFLVDQHPSMITLKTAKPVRNVVMGVFNPIASKYRWILINSEPIIDIKTKSAQVVVTTFVDITERKKAEQMLEESEEKFRTLVEESPSMIFINVNDRVVYANNKCEQETGYTRGEFYSADFSFHKLIASEYKERFASSFNNHLINQEVSPFEFSLVTKEGKVIQAILNSKLIKYEGKDAILAIVTII